MRRVIRPSTRLPGPTQLGAGSMRHQHVVQACGRWCAGQQWISRRRRDQIDVVQEAAVGLQRQGCGKGPCPWHGETDIGAGGERVEPALVEAVVTADDKLKVARIGLQSFGHGGDDAGAQAEQHQEWCQDCRQRKDEAKRHPPFVDEVPPREDRRLFPLPPCAFRCHASRSRSPLVPVNRRSGSRRLRLPAAEPP